MPFVIDDSNLPAILTSQPMTDQEFTAFCAEHPDLFFEMTKEGEIIVMAPAHSLTSVRNAAITAQLSAWTDDDGCGVSSDSSGGFVLPNGARRSPDAAWTRKERLKTFTPEELNSFWHLCPDFVIELRSDTDRLRTLKNKMTEYIENGTQLGWLIDPTVRSVTVYRPHGEVETRTNIDSLTGEGPLATFTLNLQRIWNPLQ